MSANARFCPSCGQPSAFGLAVCPRCGNPLPAMAAAPSTGGVPLSASSTASPGWGPTPPPAYDGKPARGGFPGWIIGVIACVVAAPVLVAVLGIVAAIAIPNFLKYQARAKSAKAKVDLVAIWTAEKAWADAHGGEYAEFDVDETDQSDSGFQGLGVTLQKPLHHGYSAYYIGSTLWIVASGNIDEDTATDDWELSSDDPTPFHTSDDVTDETTPSRQPSPDAEESDEEYEGTTGGQLGGIVGGVVGGLGASTDSHLETQVKAGTARMNLEAIWAREKSYKAAHASYMAFTDGNATTWAALGVKLPAEPAHHYSAKVIGSRLVLTATGNLDDDEFEDLWTLDSDVGIALQDRADALDLDLTALQTPAKKGG